MSDIQKYEFVSGSMRNIVTRDLTLAMEREDGNPERWCKVSDVEPLEERIKELEENKASHDVRCNRYHRDAEEREQDLCNRIKELEEQDNE